MNLGAFLKVATIGTIGLALSAASAPPAPDVVETPIADLQAKLASGQTSSHALVAAYLARIAAYDQAGPRLNSIVTLNKAALAQADALDRERREKGPRGPLHGIPILVKDNYDTADMPTSGGTLALATLQPSADAVQVARLRAAGAIILGKTAMHELAAGMTTVSSLTGYTRNPYDPARSPGGSSGGTGAAIAASFAAAGMGTDTCGSIRIPSAYQNLFGLRATKGLSSTEGVMPLSSTQDVAGPLARSVADLAVMLDATAGATGRPSYRDALRSDGLKGARIGLLRSMVGTAPEDKEGQDVLDRALVRMREQGASIADVAIPGMDDLLRDSSVLVFEFKYDLVAYLAHQPHPPVASLTEILARGLDHDDLDTRLRQRDSAAQRDETGYRAALAKRRALHDLVVRVMADQHLDALLYPTTLRRPPLIGGDDSGFVPNCQFSATTGLPAMAIPAGFTDRGLPVGLELVGIDFAEPTLLRLAYAWEQGNHPRRPPFSTPPLIDGQAPHPLDFTATIATSSSGPRAIVRFRYDPITASLDADAAVTGPGRDDVIALTLQRARDGGPGPVINQLLIAGRQSGTTRMTLPARDRADLLAGRFYVALYTRAAPLGAGRATVSVR